ncbi:hypothetical protein [Vibrio nigripulchritudo]|uniref:hypothetical protein n=1 Tax=Vibrio nigripulchritudo TaxID=28173 RepID=UPI0003B22844|nr:hypothetical protein [Vibrio nigripulchritudo]CCN72166.1 conserved hypothetical protein [Vibrio nigripulchritudo SFn118]
MKMPGSVYFSENVYVRRFVILLAIVLVGMVTWMELCDDDILHQNPTQEIKPDKPPAATGHSESHVNVELTSESPESDKPDTNEKELETSLKEQFSIIASAYAKELQHPGYSPPLDDEDPRALNPNRFHKVELPILGGKQKAAIRLEKYRYFYPEPIRVFIETPLEIQQVHVDLRDVKGGNSLARQTVEGSEVVFKSKPDWPEELRVKAKVTFAQGDDVLTADFRYYLPVGKVTGVEPPVSEDADMVIPVSLELNKQGTYRLRASLFSSNGKPVASLTATKKLPSGGRVLNLKAHKSVLKGHQSEFELRYIQLEKLSDFPGQKNGYGISEKATYSLGQFDLAQLSDEPYQPSEEEKSRLEFLKNASQ